MKRLVLLIICVVGAPMLQATHAEYVEIGETAQVPCAKNCKIAHTHIGDNHRPLHTLEAF